MTGGNIQRGMGATVQRGGLITLGGVLGGLLALGPAALGQEVPRTPAVLAAPAWTEATPPDAEAARAALGLVDRWVRAWDIPPDRVEVSELGEFAVAGAAVTLRLDGRVVGRGEYLAPDAAASALSLRRATRLALAQAHERAVVGSGALAESQARQSAERIDISLELAGAAVVRPWQSVEQVNAEAAPGLDGVVVRIGDRVEGAFPAGMMLLRQPAGVAVGAALARLTGEPSIAVEPLDKSLPARGALVYSFKVTQIAQAGGARGGLVLFRGGRIVEGRDMTAATLRQWADAMAAHIRGRGRGDDGTAYARAVDPVSGQEMDIAGVMERAVAAAALAEHARVRGDAASLALAQRLLAAVVDAAETPNEAAIVCWAESLVRRAGAEGLSQAQRLSLLATVRNAPPEADGGEALRALALASASRWEPSVREEAEAKVRGIYRDAPQGRLVTHMPWLGLAELELAGDAGPVPAAQALRDMREMVWRHQLTPEDAGDSGEDMAGGIVFTAASNPLPTWQSVRPLVFLAKAMGDIRLTEQGEVLAELSHLLKAARFVRQLTMDEASCYACVDAQRAKGGVRAAVWDARQPLEATALSLIAVSGLLDSMEQVRARGSKSTPPTTRN